jgi:hypothetical protein
MVVDLRVARRGAIIVRECIQAISPVVQRKSKCGAPNADNRAVEQAEKLE